MKLPPGERARFPLLLLALPLVSLSLAAFGYAGTRRMIARASPQAGRSTPTATDMQSAERLAQLLALAGNHGPLRATCLRQSLLSYLLLRRRGFDPVLHLGARRLDGRFDAHAWVELAGRALAQTDLQHRPFRTRTA